jgi:hypothetical protein
VYIIRQITDMSLPNIGKIIERDHSTVISSLDTIEKRMAQNPVFRTEMEEMVKEIKGSLFFSQPIPCGKVPIRQPFFHRRCKAPVDFPRGFPQVVEKCVEKMSFAQFSVFNFVQNSKIPHFS